MADPFLSNVVLLCHFDGANGQTTTVDSSPTTKALTITGGGNTLVTATAKFGPSSYFNNANTNYINSPDSADWAFGSGQFTVEAFIYPTSAISGVIGIVTQWASPPNRRWFFGFNGNTLNLFYSTTGSDVPSVTGAYTPTLNQWVHVAVDRDASNVLRVYANGVVIASATVTATLFNAAAAPLRIGNDTDFQTRGFIGNIDEVRITKGVARYAGAFTPPTAPFDDATGVTLPGRISARSSGQAAATILSAGVTLGGTTWARSAVRGFILPIVPLGGRISGSSRAGLVQLPNIVVLAGRIGARSRGALTERGVRVLQARSFAASRARGSLSFRLLGPQNAVTLNV